MTENGDPYENSIAERVNGILKDEFDIAEGFINHGQAAKEIKHTIGIYNTKRPHLSCEMMTPDQAHETGKFKMTKWGGRKKYNTKKLNAQKLPGYSDNFLNPSSSKKIIGNNLMHKTNLK